MPVAQRATQTRSRHPLQAISGRGLPSPINDRGALLRTNLSMRGGYLDTPMVGGVSTAGGGRPRTLQRNSLAPIRGPASTKSVNSKQMHYGF